MAEKADYNRFGERITASNLKVPIKESFVDDAGIPRWSEFIENGDSSGFDMRNVEDNGKYIKRVVLPIGKRIIRYGFPNGVFTTDADTSYDLLSLPYKEESMPYHEYVVIGECEVECVVDKGRIAPGFESKGGAVQYRHYNTIHDSMQMGILEENLEWLNMK